MQLRKACRILDGIRALRDIDRHHTLVVEGSVAVLERTVQFYVIELWKNHRNGTYYQQERATAEQAAAMVAYAECMHDHIPKLAGRAHDCIC